MTSQILVKAASTGGRAGGGMFRWLGTAFTRFPRGMIALIIIVIFLFGAATKAVEEDNPAIFFQELSNRVVGIDNSIEDNIIEMRTAASSEEGLPWNDMTWNTLKIIMSLYLFYWWFFLFTKLLDIIADQSRPLISTFIPFLIFFFFIQLLNNVVFNGGSFENFSTYVDSIPFKSFWSADGIIRNAAVIWGGVAQEIGAVNSTINDSNVTTVINNTDGSVINLL